jgi:transposase
MIKRTKSRNKSKRKQKQSKNASLAAAPAATTTPPELASVLPAGKALSAKPLTAKEFRAELKAQQVQRLLAQVDPQAEELVNALMGRPAAQPAIAKGDKAYAVIKLGIDVHLERYVVVRQLDGGVPQPAQSFSPAEFVEWAQKQLELAAQVYSCYEAGPFGYSLHRQLTALGLTNYVVRPRGWDEYGKQVKTDKRDAKELVLNLDRYVSGNSEAFCVVRVPSEAEEQARSRSRQRESLQKERQRLAAQGRSHALYYGAHLQGEWWREAAWKDLAVPAIVRELLEPLRRLIQAVEQELNALTQAIQAAAPADLPLGLGKLTYEVLEREICDWNRFENRRQIASYTGMCPKEDSSADRRFQGAINKHGNGRLRPLLVETSWRLVQYQPTYRPVAKWLPVLTYPKTTKSKRKQIIVAIGRGFAVDWWRVRTQRCTLEQLGLKGKPTAPEATPPPRPPAKANQSNANHKCMKANTAV